MKLEIKSCHMYRCLSKLVLLFDVTTAAATRYLRPDYRLIHNICLFVSWPCYRGYQRDIMFFRI
jgi:hypothetical protein